ncbi:MAG: 4-alpha-glucanotransferase [Polyangiaceae bacterium]|nr:4-alpha-glucanotransferase [Polyangiaceae bacterium]
MSTANVAIFPMQDLLGLGGTARMNTPGSATGNWQWRLRATELDERVATRLRWLCELIDRAHGR